jgi:DNA polymerase III epsilon subunit-like protein
VDVLRLAVLADRIDGSVHLSGDYALAAAAKRYGVPMERPHHALDDALTTAQLFLVLATRLSKHGYGTPKRLRASARPIPRQRWWAVGPIGCRASDPGGHPGRQAT